MKPPAYARMLAAGLLLWGCGGQERDREDELGLEEGSGRRELVLVERTDTDPGPAASPPDTTPPAVAAAPAESGGVTDAGRQPDAADTSAGPDEPVTYEPQGEYTVQIGVYQDARSAARLVRRLSAEGYPAYAIAQVDRPGVRVRIGYFRTRADAQRFGEIFRRDKGVEYWVDRRSAERF